MIQKIFLLVILFQIFLFSQDKIFSNLYFDNDNEGQNTFKYYIGYERDVQSNLQLNVSAGIRDYTMPNFENTYRDFRLGSNYSPLNNLSIKANVSFLFSEKWKPVFFNGLVSYSPIKLFYIEAYIEHESVGSALTNDMKYISTFYGTSVDINITNYLTFVVGGAYNTITENNNRYYQIYRIIYTLPIDWIYIDAKSKIMTGGEYSQYYFSPNTFKEHNIGIGINKELFNSQYFLRFYIGGGLQIVNSENKGLFISNLKFNADFTPNLSGIFTYGISNAISDVYGNYFYNYGTFTVIYYF